MPYAVAADGAFGSSGDHGGKGDVATPRAIGVDVWWMPLGAGGWFVRSNGRIYEWIRALRERRQRYGLYHSALVVTVPEGRYVIENAWPIPDVDGEARGVVAQGPVFSRRLARWRTLRYEVRRWRDGVIFDADWAVESPQRVSDDLATARRLLELVPHVPPLVWGRDERATGDMWNSNSVIAWVLARSGVSVEHVRPPVGGRAPGWNAGLVVAGEAGALKPRAAAGRPSVARSRGG